MKPANLSFPILPIACFVLTSLGCMKTDSLGLAGNADASAGRGGATGGATALPVGGNEVTGGATAQPGGGYSLIETGGAETGGAEMGGAPALPVGGNEVIRTGGATPLPVGGYSLVKTAGATATGGTGGFGGAGSGGAASMCQVPTTTPGPFLINFELRNSAAASAFLHRGCMGLTFDVSSCTSGYTDHVAVPVFCPCMCGGSSCPACGACAPDAGVEVGSGKTTQWPWAASQFVQQPGQSCLTRVGLLAGQYRVNVPVYATAADAAAQTNPLRTLTVDFPLSSATTVVEIVNGATDLDGGPGGAGAGGNATGGAGGAGGAGGRDGGPSCQYLTVNHFYPAPAFTFSVTLPDGSPQSCGTKFPTDGGSTVPYWPAPITKQISGWVTAVSGTELSVDTCQAGTGCSSNVYHFAVAAPGLTLTVPVGRLVSVWWWLYNGGWSCGQMLVISDSTSGTVARVWLAGSDSVVNQAFPAPFSVTRQELFCNPNPSIGQGCGGNDVPPDDYAFQFTPRSASDPPLVLATGETGTLDLTVGSGVLQHLTVHNLRSYQTLGCDDYSNWAWWATGSGDATDGGADGSQPAPSCRTDKIEFTQQTGCANDGSVEFCLPSFDAVAVAQVLAIDPTITCMQGSTGRVGCTGNQQLCLLPANCPNAASADPMPDKSWQTVCQLAALDVVAKIAPTLYE